MIKITTNICHIVCLSSACICTQFKHALKVETTEQVQSPLHKDKDLRSPALSTPPQAQTIGYGIRCFQMNSEILKLINSVVAFTV